MSSRSQTFSRLIDPVLVVPAAAAVERVVEEEEEAELTAMFHNTATPHLVVKIGLLLSAKKTR
jgi:ABC-type transporter lipoprotein component MlaA